MLLSWNGVPKNFFFRNWKNRGLRVFLKDCFSELWLGRNRNVVFCTPFKTPIYYQQYVKQGTFKKFKMMNERDYRTYQIYDTKLTILLPFDVHQMRISHYIYLLFNQTQWFLLLLYRVCKLTSAGERAICWETGFLRETLLVWPWSYNHNINTWIGHKFFFN